jgi:acetyl esterase/lipase
MKLFILAAFLAFAFDPLSAQTRVWQPSPGHTQIPLWPDTPPDAHIQPLRGPEYVTNVPWVCVGNVSQPTMTVYSPSETNTGVAMLVFPGGGYQVLAIDFEGADVCRWLNARGITGIVVKYRVPVTRVGPYGESPLALEDAQRALGLVRYHAAEWGIDPRKIGVIGFSAGGHMVTATSTHFNKRSYPAIDAADKVSCRPDFAIACYPGHLWSGDVGFKLNPNVPVTTNTPPTFIVQAEDDPVDSVNNSLVYYMALKQAGVPVEMHLYAHGGHAFGIACTKSPISAWSQLMETWLRTIGMIPE